MKFSIIIPVYNVDKYIDKCLDSIFKQKYKNYEVIIINDGSADNSLKIIESYSNKDNRFKVINQKNKGVSEARNAGINAVTGDYIIFIDSDDYVDDDLLYILNEKVSKYQTDLVRYECVVVDKNGNKLSSIDYPEYDNKNTDDIMEELITRNYVETLWLYCYKTNFWRENEFVFEKGRVHEDYGLLLKILYLANSISSINYHGYYYVQREGSITKIKSYEKIKIGVYDMFYLYLDLQDFFKDFKNKKRDVLLSYASECVILKSRQLIETDFKKYKKDLKKNKVYKYIIPYNKKKFIKKIVALISIDLYIKLFLRR